MGPENSTMENPVPQDREAIDAIRQRLEALTTDELEESMILNRRITPPQDCPEEVRRDHELRQELTLEKLNARRAAVPVKWPVPPTAEDYAAGKRTVCQHVDVRLPDGSNMRFHCRVLASEVIPWNEEASIACAVTNRPRYKTPGLLERVWRSLPWNYRPLTSDEVWALKALD